MKKLLVIDDNQDILEAVQLSLESVGYETMVALNNEEACEIINQEKPSLIIVDYLLSGSDGSQICSLIKSHAETKKIPVIMFSAHPKARDISSQCGADSFIAKPFSISELIGEVEKFLGESQNVFS